MSNKLKLLKVFCLAVALLLCPVIVPCIYASSFEKAVQQDTYVTVYLKNGTELKGTVTEEEGMIKVVSVSGDVFYYSKEEIRDIYDPTEDIMRQRMKDSLQSVRHQKKEFRRSNRLSGYFFTMGMEGTLTPSSDIFTKMVLVSVVNGFRTCNWYQIGVGMNYAYTEGLSAFDVYIRNKFLINGKNKVSPYILQDIGYRIGGSDVVSGLLFNTSVGVQFNLNYRNAITVGLFYLRKEGASINDNNAFGLKIGYTLYGNKKKK